MTDASIPPVALDHDPYYLFMTCAEMFDNAAGAGVDGFPHPFRQFRRPRRGKLHHISMQVPVLGGMARLGKWSIDSGMRNGTPRKDHENVAFGTESRHPELEPVECIPFS